IIVPLSTITNWFRELRAWTTLDVVTYYGAREARDVSSSPWRLMFGSASDVDLTIHCGHETILAACARVRVSLCDGQAQWSKAGYSAHNPRGVPDKGCDILGQDQVGDFGVR